MTNTNKYVSKVFEQYQIPITYDLMQDAILSNENKGKFEKDKYIVIIGYTSLYDGGEQALNLDDILNFMYKYDYEFVQYVVNPYYCGTEIIFKRIEKVISI